MATNGQPDFYRLRMLVYESVGAEIIGAIQISNYVGYEDNPDYWERHYIVASERTKYNPQCMTHKAMLNSVGRQELINGRYDLDRRTALHDLINRAKGAISGTE